MAAGDGNGNGAVARALVAALEKQLESFRQEIRSDLQPLIKQVAAHEEMAKSHCHELYNAEGSRIQAIVAEVQSLDERLHAFVLELKSRTDTGVSRVWAVKVILLTASVTLITSLTSQYLITHYIAK